MNNRNKLFRCEVVVKFREDRYICIDREIMIEGIVFKPMDGRKIKISFTIEAEDLDRARIYGKRVIEQILAIMCLKTNVGAIIDDFDVFEISDTCSKVIREGNGLIIVVRDVAKLKDEVFVGIGLEEKSLNEIIRLFNTLERIKDYERDYILRMLYWYNKALLEQDDINRFMLLWIALEVWKTYKFGSSRGGKHKEKMKAILQEYGYEGSFDDIYDLRCDIFHEGVREGVKNYLPLLEKCIRRILDELKEYLSNIDKDP